MKKWIYMLLACAVIVMGVGISFPYLGDRKKETADQMEKITLKWLVYGEKYKASDEVLAEFNSRLQQYLPGILVEFELVDKDEYQEKWDMKMATGERLDLAWFGNDLLNYTEEVKKGSLMALDYLLKTQGKTLLDSIPEDLWESEKKDGNIYAIPVYGPLYRSNYVVVANKIIMDRFGDLDEIVRINQENRYTNAECFEAFEPFLQGAKDHNAIGTGISYQTVCTLADKGYEGIYGADSPFVIRIFDQKLKVCNKYELESWRACFAAMAEWYRKGFIREDVKNLLNPSSEDGKLKGSIMFLDEYGEKGTAQDMIRTEYDAVRGELDGYRYISYDGCRNSIVVPKSARYPQQAVQLLNFLYSEEGKELYRLLANGIEKQHYILTDHQVVARMSNNKDGYLYQMPQNVLGNVRQNYEIAEGEFEQLEEYNTQALVSPLQGFSLDTRMIALEMEKIKLVVNKYKEELCQGTAEDWEVLYDEFIREMKEAGSTKIIEEMQKQIDAFQREKEDRK